MNDSAAAVDEAAMDPSMADATMDVAMMEDVPEMPAEEAPAAPSVVFCPGGCEAVMKIKRADDDSSTDPESDNVMSVVEYEVKFGSSGVTDGGLLFGAAISIDEEGAGVATANGVNAASAYIGAADGTWKLSFGGVDPGVDLIGNIGLADADAISAKTIVIAPVMMGTMRVKLPTEASAVQVMMPKTTLDATVKSTIKPYTFSGEIEDYFADIADDTATASATNAEATATASWQPISAPKGSITAMRKPPTTVITRGASGNADGVSVRGGTRNAAGTITGGTRIENVDNNALGVAGTTAYSNTLQFTGMTTAAAVTAATEATSRTVIGLSGKVGSFEYRITTSQPGDDAWSAGVKYTAGAITVGLGMDSNDVMGLGLTGKMGGSTISGTYVKQSGEDFTGIGVKPHSTSTATAPVYSAYAVQRKVNEWTAMGVKVKQEIGSGTSVALAYSKKDDKNGEAIARDSNKIEFDFEYGLGGGATFFAGLDRLNEDVVKVTPTNGLPIASKATKKTTTIEAGLKMAF